MYPPQNGEQQCGGAPRDGPGEVPAALARLVCTLPQICPHWKVVHHDWQRQPTQCLENTVRSEHIPGGWKGRGPNSHVSYKNHLNQFSIATMFHRMKSMQQYLTMLNNSTLNNPNP